MATVASVISEMDTGMTALRVGLKKTFRNWIRRFGEFVPIILSFDYSFE